jgi:antibiotic biosynthesis monooxygenase (ABM) superfamily enzyme
MSERTNPKPARWKTAILIWMGIYPTITIVLGTLGSYILPMKIPLYLKTLPITLIVVPLMVYAVLPLLHKLFGKWLMK